jgi:hypothetical protein
MNKTIKDYVRSCDECQRAKADKRKPAGLLQPLEVAEEPWQHTSMDFIVCLPKSTQGNDAAMVVVDRHSKQVVLAATTTDADAPGTARLYHKEVYKRHGLQESIVSDRDPKFTSRFWKELKGILGVKLRMSTRDHPQTDGQTENTNQTLEQVLRTCINYAMDDWETLLPDIEFAINSAIHPSTGFSPFQLGTGRQPKTLATVGLPDSSDVPAAREFIKKRQVMAKIAVDNMLKAQDDQARFANRHRRHVEFKQGDFVLISSSYTIPYNVRSRPKFKLQNKFHGPYEILEAVGSRAYRLGLPASLARTHPVIHVSYLKEWIDPVAVVPSRKLPPPPPPEIHDNEEFFEVEVILDKKRKGRGFQYLVRWKGCSPEHDSWEPAQKVQRKAADAVRLYEDSH